MLKRTVSILFLLVLALCAVNAAAETSSRVASKAVIPDDFSVRTIDGSTFTLSEALKDHELVIINLWATWCPPCREEFPFLQEAWSRCRDKVAMIALSVEPSDTEATLKRYAKTMGLTFPIASVGNTGLDSFASAGIPTTLVVDRTGKIASLELGAKESTQAFMNLFEDFTGDDYNPELCTYTIIAYDNNSFLPGVTVSFSSDNARRNVTTDKNGKAVFQGEPENYHVQIVEVPKGHSLTFDSGIYTEPFGQTYYLYIQNN